MTNWWSRQKAYSMPNYVTKGHFDRSMSDLRIELDNKFVTKDQFTHSMSDVSRRFDEMTTKMDAMMVILLRLDQERIFTTEWIRRIESDVTMIKNHLHLA